jgi:FkbM family methyltransferase
VTLLFSPLFAEVISGKPLVLIDAGARDGLGWPWSQLDPNVLRVIGFEPDVEECRRLNNHAPRGIEFVPTALWSSDAEVELHVARTPSCSSVHPPNEAVLARYEEVHRLPRATERTTRMPATTLDRVLAERQLECDFLKIDTQGSELDILQGAEQALDQALGVLVETWTVQVHAGQGRTGAVLEHLARHGLDVFDVAVAAAWDRDGELELQLGGKRQVTGLDVLALRDPPASQDDADPVRLAKSAAIAEVFGFPSVAASFLVAGASDPRLHALRDELIHEASRTFGRDPLSRLRRRRARTASLHD